MRIFDWFKKKNKITHSTGFWSVYYTKFGKIDGLSKTYYPTGELNSESNYKNGKDHGSYKDYYKNGQLESESIYKNGEREGEQKRYFKNGKIHEIAFFKNYKFISVERYYLDGSIIPSGVEIYSRMIDNEFRIFINDKLEGN